MPHYYFYIFQHGNPVPDYEGLECVDLDAACFEAKATARDLARYAVNDGLPLGSTCVEIRDSQNATVASITVEEILKHPNTRNLEGLQST